MTAHRVTLAAALAALALAGCGTGAKEVDDSPQRRISSDISASFNKGPTAGKPGMNVIGEPIGALPWDSNGSRQ